MIIKNRTHYYKKVWPILYNKLLAGLGLDFLDIPYNGQFCSFNTEKFVEEQGGIKVSQKERNAVSFNTTIKYFR